MDEVDHDENAVDLEDETEGYCNKTSSNYNFKNQMITEHNVLS